MCNCQTPRIASVQGRVADTCELEVPHLGIRHDGYVPNGIGVGSGDYLFFSYCLGCGQIENFKPCSDELVCKSTTRADSHG